MPIRPPSLLLAENYLLRLLLDLPSGWPSELTTVKASHAGITAILRIGPTDSQPREHRADELSGRAREILEAVQVEIDRLGRRITGAEVRAALKLAKCRWGISTINRTLADLVAAGHLANGRDGLGYGRPDAGGNCESD